jgi:hypothetical protein
MLGSMNDTCYKEFLFSITRASMPNQSTAQRERSIGFIEGALASVGFIDPGKPYGYLQVSSSWSWIGIPSTCPEPHWRFILRQAEQYLIQKGNHRHTRF